MSPTCVIAVPRIFAGGADNVIFVHQEESNWPLADGASSIMCL
jgi:hypothetical protein